MDRKNNGQIVVQSLQEFFQSGQPIFDSNQFDFQTLLENCGNFNNEICFQEFQDLFAGLC